MRIVLAALTVIALLATSSIASSPPGAVHADGIEVRSQQPQNRFPMGVNFQIFLSSNANISDVRLHFHILPDGPLATVRAVCNAGTSVTCNALAGGQGGKIAPGGVLVYNWEVVDDAGQKLSTPEQNVTYQDDRYRWESMSDGNVTVNYYRGDDAFVQSALRTARQTLDKFTALQQTTLSFPIKVWIYQTSQEMSAAASTDRDPTGSRVTLGEKVASDTVLVSRDIDTLKILRHELAHLVTGQAEKGGIGEIPAWVNEGNSVFAQEGLIDSQQQVLDLAIRRNNILPITSLSSSLNASNFLLAYAESGTIIRYMVETYGADKYAQFLAALKTDTTDGALKKTYSFDQGGLEDLWRKSVGLPAASGSTAGGTPATGAGNERALPSVVPFGSQGGGSSSSGAAATPPPSTNPPSTNTATPDEDGGSSALPIVIGAVVVVVLLAGGGIALMRKKRP